MKWSLSGLQNDIVYCTRAPCVLYNKRTATTCTYELRNPQQLETAWSLLVYFGTGKTDWAHIQLVENWTGIDSYYPLAYDHYANVPSPNLQQMALQSSAPFNDIQLIWPFCKRVNNSSTIQIKPSNGLHGRLCVAFDIKLPKQMKSETSRLIDDQVFQVNW